MSDTCPVCGKGEYVDEHTWCHVSHFACVQQANKTMRVAVEAHGRLEAENERLTWDRNKYQKLYEVWASANAARADKNFQRAEQAEAELAALKGRRCETCREFPHYHICKKDHRPVRWDTFYCSDWQARAEEGGGE